MKTRKNSSLISQGALFGKSALVATVAVAASVTSAGAITINFDEDASGNAIQDGTIINNQWENLDLAPGFDITHIKNNDNQGAGITLFNSSCDASYADSGYGTTCTGGDNDLATGSALNTEGRGNVLIIQENKGNKARKKNGLYKNPNDDGQGGTIKFNFVDPVILQNLEFLDFDKTDSNKIILTVEDAENKKTTYTFNRDNTGIGDVIKNKNKNTEETFSGAVKQDAQQVSDGNAISQAGFDPSKLKDNPYVEYFLADNNLSDNEKYENSIWDFYFGQALGPIESLEVNFNGTSGAISELTYEKFIAPPEQEPSSIEAFTGTDNAGLKSAPFQTEEINQYLIIGTGNGQVGDAINFQNIEAGANTKMKAGDPTDIKDSNNVMSDDDPNLVGVFEKRWDEEKGILTSDKDENQLPFTNAPLFAGIDNSGTAAVTSESGKFSYSNSTAYTDTDFAVRCASEKGNRTGECQNNDTNDSRWRTSDGIQSGVINSNTINQYDDKITDKGMIDGDDGGNGVIGNYDHDKLIEELKGAWNYIDGLDEEVEHTINYRAEDFKDGYSLFDIDSKDTDGDGLAIIDIDAGSDDFDINNFDWVLDGDGSTFAIFRIRGNSNMLMSNSSITLGTGGIGGGSASDPISRLGAIFVHYEEPTGNTDEVFNFNNVILNGAGFWDLNAFRNGNYDDSVGTQLTIQNGQGCSQFISSKHDFDNGRYHHCDASALYKKMTHTPKVRVPEPSSIAALAFIGGGIFLTRRRQSK